MRVNDNWQPKYRIGIKKLRWYEFIYSRMNAFLTIQNGTIELFLFAAYTIGYDCDHKSANVGHCLTR